MPLWVLFLGLPQSQAQIVPLPENLKELMLTLSVDSTKPAQGSEPAFKSCRIFTDRHVEIVTQTSSGEEHAFRPVARRFIRRLHRRLDVVRLARPKTFESACRERPFEISGTWNTERVFVAESDCGRTTVADSKATDELIQIARKLCRVPKSHLFQTHP